MSFARGLAGARSPAGARGLAGLAVAILLMLAGGSAMAAFEVKEGVLGHADAPVTVIEYASLGCPHCAAFQAGTLPELKLRYLDTGKVKLVFRDFPLDENALNAAKLAHCAGPDRYESFVDAYFKAQGSWAHAKDPMAGIRQLAKLGGLSDTTIDACLADKTVEDAILNGQLEAQQKLGVNSTPTFIVNGKSYAGNRSIDELAKILDPLLPH